MCGGLTTIDIEIVGMSAEKKPHVQLAFQECTTNITAHTLISIVMLCFFVNVSSGCLVREPVLRVNMKQSDSVAPRGRRRECGKI